MVKLQYNSCLSKFFDMNKKLKDEGLKTSSSKAAKTSIKNVNSYLKIGLLNETYTEINCGKHHNNKVQEDRYLINNLYDKLSVCQSASVVRGNTIEVNFGQKGRKVKLTKDTVKRYRVIIRYIEISDDERKIKRAIIEDILKNS